MHFFAVAMNQPRNVPIEVVDNEKRHMRSKVASPSATNGRSNVPSQSTVSIDTLVRAVAQNNLSLLQETLETHGELVNARSSTSSMTLLHVAAMHGHESIIRFLIHKGANVRTLTSDLLRAVDVFNRATNNTGAGVHEVELKCMLVNGMPRHVRDHNAETVVGTNVEEVEGATPRIETHEGTNVVPVVEEKQTPDGRTVHPLLSPHSITPEKPSRKTLKRSSTDYRLKLKSVQRARSNSSNDALPLKRNVEQVVQSHGSNSGAQSIRQRTEESKAAVVSRTQVGEQSSSSAHQQDENERAQSGIYSTSVKERIKHFPSRRTTHDDGNASNSGEQRTSNASIRERTQNLQAAAASRTGIVKQAMDVSKLEHGTEHMETLEQVIGQHDAILAKHNASRISVAPQNRENTEVPQVLTFYGFDFDRLKCSANCCSKNPPPPLVYFCKSAKIPGEQTEDTPTLVIRIRKDTWDNSFDHKYKLKFEKCFIEVVGEDDDDTIVFLWNFPDDLHLKLCYEQIYDIPLPMHRFVLPHDVLNVEGKVLQRHQDVLTAYNTIKRAFNGNEHLYLKPGRPVVETCTYFQLVNEDEQKKTTSHVKQLKCDDNTYVPLIPSTFFLRNTTTLKKPSIPDSQKLADLFESMCATCGIYMSCLHDEAKAFAFAYYAEEGADGQLILRNITHTNFVSLMEKDDDLWDTLNDYALQEKQDEFESWWKNAEAFDEHTSSSNDAADASPLGRKFDLKLERKDADAGRKGNKDEVRQQRLKHQAKSLTLADLHKTHVQFQNMQRGELLNDSIYYNVSTAALWSDKQQGRKDFTLLMSTVKWDSVKNVILDFEKFERTCTERINKDLEIYVVMWRFPDEFQQRSSETGYTKIPNTKLPVIDYQLEINKEMTNVLKWRIEYEDTDVVVHILTIFQEVNEYAEFAIMSTEYFIDREDAGGSSVHASDGALKNDGEKLTAFVNALQQVPNSKYRALVCNSNRDLVFMDQDGLVSVFNFSVMLTMNRFKNVFNRYITIDSMKSKYDVWNKKLQEYVENKQQQLQTSIAHLTNS